MGIDKGAFHGFGMKPKDMMVDNTFNVEKLPEELTNRFKELLRYNNRDK